jgi:hypothetical protein
VLVVNGRAEKTMLHRPVQPKRRPGLLGEIGISLSHRAQFGPAHGVVKVAVSAMSLFIVTEAGLFVPE